MLALTAYLLAVIAALLAPAVAANPRTAHLYFAVFTHTVVPLVLLATVLLVVGL